MFKYVFILTVMLSFSFCCISRANPSVSDNPGLTGRVTDTEGNPISFAVLTLQEISSTVYSDAKGRYMFISVPSGNYHLNISRNGFQNRISLINVSDSPEELDIVLTRSLLETPVIDVTSSFGVDEISNSAYSISVIQPRSLTKLRSFNVAGTIQNLPGINNYSTGNSIGKPVIRGLSSQSVLVVHDGIKHESQQWGDEHGPEISLFNLDRIEVLRGPASLIYGADGIGGVVNLITSPLTYSNSAGPVKYGRIDINGFSVNKEGVGALTFGMGFKNVSFKLYGGYRKGSNIMTPDGEFLIQTPDGEKVISGGELSNSGSKEIEAGISFGTKFKSGTVTGSFENFTRELQIHEDPEEEPFATPNQKIITSHFELKGDFKVSDYYRFEPIFAFDVNDRKEFESIEDKENGNEALHLKLSTVQSDLRLHHGITKDINGTFGGSFILQKNKSTAAEKLIPDYDAFNFGVYFLEKYDKKYFTLTGGLRYDYKTLNTKETVFEFNEQGETKKTVGPDYESFQAFTGSAGVIYKPNENGELFFNIGKGWRPPSEFELYVDGVHEGTGRFERGLKINDIQYSPDPEESFNIDIGARYRSRILNAELSLFRNSINNFIYPSPTGEIDSASSFQIYDIKQDKSNFWGFEYSIQFNPVEWALIWLKGDYVRAENVPTGNPLPFTPPMKNIIELKIQESKLGFLNNPYFSVETKFVSSQTRVDPLESATDNYTLINSGLGFDLVTSGTIASVDFSASNLFDEKYSDHLSRYRYYALSPGRSFNLKLSLPFKF